MLLEGEHNCTFKLACSFKISISKLDSIGLQDLVWIHFLKIIVILSCQFCIFAPDIKLLYCVVNSVYLHRMLCEPPSDNNNIIYCQTSIKGGLWCRESLSGGRVDKLEPAWVTLGLSLVRSRSGPHHYHIFFSSEVSFFLENILFWINFRDFFLAMFLVENILGNPLQISPWIHSKIN